VISLPNGIGWAITQYCSDFVEASDIRNGVIIASRNRAIAILKRVFDFFSILTITAPYKYLTY
jgi:hypothetical protein